MPGELVTWMSWLWTYDRPASRLRTLQGKRSHEAGPWNVERAALTATTFATTSGRGDPGGASLRLAVDGGTVTSQSNGA